MKIGDRVSLKTPDAGLYVGDRITPTLIPNGNIGTVKFISPNPMFVGVHFDDVSPQVQSAYASILVSRAFVKLLV